MNGAFSGILAQAGGALFYGSDRFYEAWLASGNYPGALMRTSAMGRSYVGFFIQNSINLTPFKTMEYGYYRHPHSSLATNINVTVYAANRSRRLINFNHETGDGDWLSKSVDISNINECCFLGFTVARDGYASIPPSRASCENITSINGGLGYDGYGGGAGIQYIKFLV